jgi:SAM-dependent methyltransferase
MKKVYQPILKDYVKGKPEEESGHRRYVGGNWETAGRLQFHFLRQEGLQSDNFLLDIGCGSLRAGRYFIDFLEHGRYCGVDHHKWLIDAGIKSVGIFKEPKFVISDSFHFQDFGTSFKYIIAKSVFTHMPKDKIKECLKAVAGVLERDGNFYASISVGSSINNPKEPDDKRRFRYTVKEIRELAPEWNVVELGRRGTFNQIMLKFNLRRKINNISIVTAAFRGELMDRVRASIEKQTFKRYEWIIVNDAQKSVRDWYEKSGLKGSNWTQFVDIEKQVGRFGLFSRNIGANIANFSRIIFLDDDNEWEENHLQSLIDAEEATGKIPYCDMMVKGKKPGSNYVRTKHTGISRQGIDLGCILYRKQSLDRFGYFINDAQVTFDFNFIKRIYDGEGGQDAFVATRQPSLIFWHKRY